MLIFYTKVIKFYWLMLLLYPGEPLVLVWLKFLNNYQSYFYLKLNTLVESVDPNLLTREDNSIQHFLWVIPPVWLRISSKIQFLNNYDRHWNETQHTCSLSNGEPITTGDPVICISRFICPCFDIVHRNLGFFLVWLKFLNNYQSH